jgi:hypothetical protein
VDELLGRDLVGLPEIEFGPNWRRAHPLPSNMMPRLLGLCDAEVDPLAPGCARMSRLDFVGAELTLAVKPQDHDGIAAEELQKGAGDAGDTALRIRHWRGLRLLRGPSVREA